MKPQALTVTQFCDATGLSRSTVYRWIEAGTLKAVRFTGESKWLIPLSELDRLEVKT